MCDEGKGETMIHRFSCYTAVNPRAKRTSLLCLSLVFALFLWGCTATHSDSASLPAEQKTAAANPSPPHSTNDPLSPEISKTMLGEVWRHFIQDGTYRLANSADFQFPEWAIRHRLIPPKENIEVPFIFSWIGYAAIVVDVTREGTNRFGVVIFTIDEGSTKEENLRKGIHWFLRNRDLSRSVLDASSGRLFLTEFEDQGTYTTCDIGWDDHKRKYICKKRYTNKAD
jgi:hypothetical protein